MVRRVYPFLRGQSHQCLPRFIETEDENGERNRREEMNKSQIPSAQRLKRLEIA